MIPSPEIREFDIKDYLEIIWKHWWIIVSLLVLVVGFVAFYDLRAPKIYKATATILIEKKKLKVTEKKGQEIYTREVMDKDYYWTQYDLLKSRSLAERVVKKLDLVRYPEFAGENAAKRFLYMIEALWMRKSNFVYLSVSNRDPSKAAELANIWAREYIAQDIEKKAESAKYGVSWLEKQLVGTLAKLQAAEKKLNDFIKENKIVSTPDEGGKKGLIESLKGQKSELEREIHEASRMYAANHPRLVSLKSQLKAVENQLAEETENFFSLQEKMSEYNVLKREVETYKSLYEDFIQRAQELNTFKEFDASNIQIIDPAEVPKKPVSPQPKKDILFAGVMGLVLGVAICFLLEFMDTTLRTSEEVEFYAKMPFLGYIPLAPKEAKDEWQRNLVSHLKPESHIAEAFRNVRVSLIFASPEEKPLKTLVVTSSVPMEGKTFIASNLAISFAQANEPVLLVDADMKKGKLGKKFKAETKNGLSSLLAGVCSLEEVIVPTYIPNLSLLPSGPPAPSPADLLSSEKLKNIIEKVKTKFQRIIIDVPPVLNLTDALIWSDKCDGLVHVIKAGSTSFKDINEARKKFEGKLKITGAVLNMAKIAKKDLYYYFEKRS